MLEFQKRLEYGNANKRINTIVNYHTLCKNVVRFGPVIAEFMRIQWVYQKSESSKTGISGQLSILLFKRSKVSVTFVAAAVL